MESWGTVRLAYAALVRSKGSFPTIFFDTTGCAFTYLVAKIVFGCKVSAYVHYPTNDLAVVVDAVGDMVVGVVMSDLVVDVGIVVVGGMFALGVVGVVIACIFGWGCS